MSENRRKQIKQNLLSKDTDYLIDVWQHGDADEWEKEVFEIIEGILLERTGNVPPQSAERQASQILGRVEDYLNRKELGKALNECEGAIQVNPNSAVAYNYLGEIFDEMGQLDNAITNYQKAIQLAPELKEAWVNMLSVELALEYAYDDEFEQSLAECKAAKPFMPNIAIAYNYLGLILQTIGQLEAAIDAYLQAIQLNPRFYVARQNLANARVILEEEQYLRVSSLSSDKLSEITETSIEFDKFSMITDGGNPIPGWMYLDANAFLLRGWAGHHIRPRRSGYDPLDTDFEQAHMQGVIIRRLITLKFRTRNLFNLLMMLYMGILFTLYGAMPFMLGGWLGAFTGIIASPYLIVGIALLINIFSSLLSKKPKEDEDNGRSFY